MMRSSRLFPWPEVERQGAGRIPNPAIQTGAASMTPCQFG
jgi:hypothetical protein